MRCQHPDCKKKLTLIMLSINKCLCQGCYCDNHKFPEMHSCTVNHREIGREILRKTLVEVGPDKIIPI